MNMRRRVLVITAPLLTVFISPSAWRTPDTAVCQAMVESAHASTPQEAYDQGVLLRKQSCLSAALAMFQAAAKAKIPGALFELGFMYMGQSHGAVLPSARKAFRYFSEAAELGHPDAMAMTAMFYETDNKVIKKADPAYAFSLYQQSAQAGSKAGMARLVEVYRLGELGQKASPEQAAYWQSQLK